MGSTRVGKVGILVPSMGQWIGQFGECLAGVIAHEAARQQPLSLYTAYGSMLCQSRHDLVLRAIRADCTHLMFFDSDMAFKPDIIERLASWNEAVVTGNYVTKALPPKPVAHYEDNTPVFSQYKEGLEPVRLNGLGAAFIRADVFKQMTPPFFMQDWIPAMGNYCGEDVYLFEKIKEATGHTVYVDHGVSKTLIHIGFCGFKHDMVEETEND